MMLVNNEITFFSYEMIFPKYKIDKQLSNP